MLIVDLARSLSPSRGPSLLLPHCVPIRFAVVANHDRLRLSLSPPSSGPPSLPPSLSVSSLISVKLGPVTLLEPIQKCSAVPAVQGPFSSAPSLLPSLRLDSFGVCAVIQTISLRG